MELAQHARGQWQSRIGAILAAAGSAVGLGNIWKFPYLAGANGGGAFVLIYLLCILFIGIPLILTEFVLGRKTERNPVGAFRTLNPSRAWMLPGISGVAAGFLILSFYSVVAGWALHYTLLAGAGLLDGLTAASASSLFRSLVSQTWLPLLWHLIFMAVTVYIVAIGIENGIEKWSKLLMPLLLLLILLLAIRSGTLPGAGQGIRFYLKPDFAKLGTGSILAALGQAFFSLSVGMGCMITYGSYIARGENLFKVSGQVALIDTFIALTAGLVIFPAAFAYGVEPGAGPGLVFITLPTIFAQMPLGSVFAFLFFVLLSIAAVTSSISLLETVVAYFVDEKHWERHKAAIVCGSLAFVLGILSSLSQGAVTLNLFGRTFLDAVDFLTSNILLPVGGLLTAIFVGWRMNREDVLAEAMGGSGVSKSLATIWLVIVRVLAPVVIAAIFANAIGLF